MTVAAVSRIGGARPNDKRRHDAVIVRLRAELAEERRLRLAAEKNARAFHAQLLRLKVAALPKRQPEGE